MLPYWEMQRAIFSNRKRGNIVAELPLGDVGAAREAETVQCAPVREMQEN